MNISIIYIFAAIVSASLVLLSQNIFAQQQEIEDKTQLINAVFQDANENCNLDITKYSEKTIQTSLEICKKGMAWLKIECDANYDNVPLCKENMPNIKKFFGNKLL